ncbi:MAG: hypothetical protein ABW122_15900 [Ilumatobacteraceae bacterium]
MVALTFENARDWAVAVVAGAVVLAVLMAWLIKAIAAKLLTVAVLAVLVGLVWTQRSSVQDCADRVRTTLAAGAVDDTTCTFFGREVTVSSPLE